MAQRSVNSLMRLKMCKAKGLGRLRISDVYNNHFQPDGPLGGLANIFRALGTGFVETGSSYEFDEVRT